MAVIAVYMVVVAYGSSIISSGYHLKAICSGSTKEKVVAITFDDGPHPVTMTILDVLKQHNAKAAFFCIGKNIEEYPEIMRRIVAEGHTIGNHSYSHTRTFDFYRKNRVVDELKKTDALLEQFSGKRNIYFRPPYGVTNPSIRRAVAETKHKVIGWNIRSLDTLIKDRETLLMRIKSMITPGGIVLLHDTSEHTAEALEELLKFLADNKYRVVPLEELLQPEYEK